MTNSFRADLHCHSTFSDGSLTPEQLIKHAADIGLQGLSITDHDTTAAYPEAFSIAKDYHIRLIPGAEFSSDHKGESVHILAYAYKVGHPALQALVQRHVDRRKKRNLAILQRLAEHGMVVLPEEISADDHTVGRPHIAQAMLDHGYVGSIQEAFHKYIGDGKPCHCRGIPILAEETLSIIHQAGGLAVLAHPHLTKNQNLIDSLITLPFDGIECFYARFSASEEKPWVDIAVRKNWIQTGGSDFHGASKPGNALGSSWISETTFNLLEKHFRSQS